MTNFIEEYMSQVKPNEKRTLLLEIDEVPSFDEWEVFEREVLQFDATGIHEDDNKEWYDEVIHPNSIIVYIIKKNTEGVCETILLEDYTNMKEYLKYNEDKTYNKMSYSMLKDYYLDNKEDNLEELYDIEIEGLEELQEMFNLQEQTIKEMEEEIKAKDVIIAFLYDMLEYKIKAK